MKIKELEISQREKDCLNQLYTRRDIAQIAALLDVAYSTAFQRMKIWEAKDWIRLLKDGRGRVGYVLNSTFFSDDILFREENKGE